MPRMKKGLVLDIAQLLRSMTGDPVRIIDKVYIQRWTGTKWVLFLKRKR